jgi:hypothetical protein
MDTMTTGDHMDTTKTDKALYLTGTKQELDLATAWARGRLYSVFGKVEGEERFRKLPALGVLLAFREHAEEAPEC